jgi:hypothetical protein
LSKFDPPLGGPLELGINSVFRSLMSACVLRPLPCAKPI